MNTTLSEFGILALPSNRSKAYLQNLLKNKIVPSIVILMIPSNRIFTKLIHKIIPDKILGIIIKLFNNLNSKTVPNDLKYFDSSEPVIYTITKNKIKYKKIYTADCNSLVTINAIKTLTEKYFIYSASGILKSEILSLKRFIHIHPGLTPLYKGSTCFYYSIINKGFCGATAFEMQEGIDTGDIIAQANYPMPDTLDLDNIYDPYIRSDLLVKILKLYLHTGEIKAKPQNKTIGDTYYVIHPVLKHLAILKCQNNINGDS